MQNNNLLKQPSLYGQLILISVLGILLGVSSIWLPPFLLLIGIGGVVYLIVSSMWPEFAVLGILLFTSTIFDIYAYPSIPIGIGNLIISDVLVFALIGIIILRLRTQSISFLNKTPLDLPLLAFYATGILATVVGMLNSRITFNQSLGDVRIANFYLTFFIVTNLVRNEKQLRRLYSGIIFLAIFVAVAMIIQYSLGNTVQILPGRTETLNTAGSLSFGVTRVLPPGESLILVGFVCIAVQMLFIKRTSFRFFINFAILAVVGLAVLMTFNRSFWTGIVIAFVAVSVLLSFRDKIRYAELASLAVIVGMIVVTPLLTIGGSKTQAFLDSVLLRISTLFDPQVSQEKSLQYRVVENEYAYPQIVSHPFLGLGLGADYRPADKRINASSTDYIHNGHLWVILKTGLVGYLFFVWTLIMFINRSFQYWKTITDSFFRSVVLSFGAIVFSMLFIAFVSPIFRNWFWAPIIGVILGMGEVIIKLYGQKSDLGSV